jgi:hypothetical protein
MAGGRRLGKGADHWALDSPHGAPREPWPRSGFSRIGPVIGAMGVRASSGQNLILR